MKPSVGRIVHYTNLGDREGKYPPEIQAALITGINADGTIALQVFYRTGIFAMPSVEQTEAAAGTEQARGRWAWPEVVDGIGVKLPVADTTGTLPNMIFAADSIDSLKAERDDLKTQLEKAERDRDEWRRLNAKNVEYVNGLVRANGGLLHEDLSAFIARIGKERDEAVKSKNGADDLCRAACVAADTAQTENAKLKQRITDLERHSAALNDQCVQQQIALSGIRAVFQQHDAPGSK